MRVAILALVACGCEAPSPPRASRAASERQGTRYLAIGDSFTIGTGSSPKEAFPARLVERWRARGCDVELENVAVNGYATDDVIREELPALASYRPTFVTIAVGANDIVRDHTEDEYRANLRRIFAEAKTTKARVVALPQPDWSQSPVATAFGDRAVIAARIRRFDAILAEEARASGATYVDARPRPGDVARDGLHPSAAAHDAWAEAIAASVSVSDACPASP